MMFNPNEVPRYEITPEMRQRFADQSVAELIAKREAERRAAEFPIEVTKTLGLLARELAALRTRVDAVEATVARKV